MSNILQKQRGVLALAAGLGAVAYFAVATISPVIAIACCFVPLIMVAVLRCPMIGFGVLTFLIPLERMQRFTDDSSDFTISVMRLLALGCFGALVIQRYVQKKTIRFDPLMLVYGGYLLFAVFSVFSSSDPAGAKRAIGTVFSNCLFFLLYYNFIEERRQIYTLLAIWMAANILAAGYSVYDWHLGSGRTGGIQTEVDPGAGVQTTENRWSTVWEDRAEWETLSGVTIRRSMGPTSHAAVYGINLIMTIPFFFVALNRYRRPAQQLAIWAVLALFGYNILLTNTRAVMLMAGIAGVLCIVVGLFRVRTPHVIALIIGMLLAVPAMPKDIKDRILDPSNYTVKNSSSLRVRLEYWNASREIFSEKWLSGMGVGNEVEVPKHMKSVSAEKTTVHNTYLQFLLEVGVFGWLIFFGFVGLLLHHVVQACRYFRRLGNHPLEVDILRAIIVAMVSVLMFGLQVDVFLFPLKGWWLLAMVGLVLYRWAERGTANASPSRVDGANPAKGLTSHAQLLPERA
jgi:hypothetical protein